MTAGSAGPAIVFLAVTIMVFTLAIVMDWRPLYLVGAVTAYFTWMELG